MTTEQVAAAIDELAARHLIRILPDGQACRISPAEYMLDLEGQRGLIAHAEPVQGTLACKSRSIAWRPVRADIAAVLGTGQDESACILQMLWTVSGRPGAATTTYLAEQTAKPIIAAMENAELAELRTILPLAPTRTAQDQVGGSESDAFRTTTLAPRSLHIDMQQPPPWAAKALRLPACEPAIGISVAYTDAGTGQPGALTIAVLQPREFRVIVDSAVAAPPVSRAAF